MNIVLLTQASQQYYPLRDLTLPSKIKYCAKWGLNLVSSTLPPATCRVEEMLNVLKQTDWLFYIGADALIMNSDISIETILDEYAYRVEINDNGDDIYSCTSKFVVGVDVLGFNNDIFLLKNGAVGITFLQQVLNKTTEKYSDQQAMRLCYPSQTSFVPQRVFNSYKYDEYTYTEQQVSRVGGSYVEGDFILHFPGLPFSRRVLLCKEYSLLAQ